MKKHLKHLLSPQSVAVIGASPEPGKLGYNISDNLIRGGFHGEVFLINPNYRRHRLFRSRLCADDTKKI